MNIMIDNITFDKQYSAEVHVYKVISYISFEESWSSIRVKTKDLIVING